MLKTKFMRDYIELVAVTGSGWRMKAWGGKEAWSMTKHSIAQHATAGLPTAWLPSKSCLCPNAPIRVWGTHSLA